MIPQAAVNGPRCPNRIIIAYPANRCRDPKTVEKGANVRLIIRPLDVSKNHPPASPGARRLRVLAYGSGRTPGAAVACRASERAHRQHHASPTSSRLQLGLDGE